MQSMCTELVWSASQILARLSLKRGEPIEADLLWITSIPSLLWKSDLQGCFSGHYLPLSLKWFKSQALLIASFNLCTRLLQEFKAAYTALPSLPSASVWSSQDFHWPLTTAHGSERQQQVSKRLPGRKKRVQLFTRMRYGHKAFNLTYSVILWERNLFYKVSVMSLQIQ